MILWFDELKAGMRFSSPGATLTEDAIIRFGLEWDAQPFHIDREAARSSVFGGLVASGIHTLALALRLHNENSPMRGSALAGTGLDNLRWLKPARPGDTLKVECEIVECRPSSRGDRGRVVQRMEVLNQKGETIARFDLSSIVARRPVRP